MNRPAIPLLFAFCLLSACAQLPDSQAKAPVTQSPTISRLDVLDFAESFSELSLEGQKKELQQNSQNRNDMTSRIKVALIYALPTSKLRDTNKAQALLDDLAKDKYLDGDRKTLTLIMRDYIAEINRSGNKAREEQKRADALQQKLDELKNIEKSMLEREQGNRK